MIFLSSFATAMNVVPTIEMNGMYILDQDCPLIGAKAQDVIHVSANEERFLVGKVLEGSASDTLLQYAVPSQGHYVYNDKLQMALEFLTDQKSSEIFKFKRSSNYGLKILKVDSRGETLLCSLYNPSFPPGKSTLLTGTGLSSDFSYAKAKQEAIMNAGRNAEFQCQTIKKGWYEPTTWPCTYSCSSSAMSNAFFYKCSASCNMLCITTN